MIRCWRQCFKLMEERIVAVEPGCVGSEPIGAGSFTVNRGYRIGGQAVRIRGIALVALERPGFGIVAVQAIPCPGPQGSACIFVEAHHDIAGYRMRIAAVGPE